MSAHEIRYYNEKLKLNFSNCPLRALILYNLLQIQERISKFDKFVKENEAKRKRAIMKYQQEKKLKEIKSKELERYYSELSLLLLR